MIWNWCERKVQKMEFAQRHGRCKRSMLLLLPQTKRHSTDGDTRHYSTNRDTPSMGGVSFIPPEFDKVVAILWRKPFPKSVQAKLVSFTNRTGTINNSDLELCGNVTHHNIVAQFADILERTIRTLSDNIDNVYWLRKGSTTTTWPLPIYHDYKPTINNSTGTYLFTTISRDLLMIWLTFVCVRGISLIHTSLLILV